LRLGEFEISHSQGELRRMQVAGAHLHAIFGRIPFLHNDGTSSPEGVNSGKILREVSCHLFRLSVDAENYS